MAATDTQMVWDLIARVFRLASLELKSLRTIHSAIR